jgi:aspartate aminotransferase-like enzyme
MGCKIVGEGRPLSPAVTTIALPPTLNSRTLGKQLAAAGYLLSYMSSYLVEQNWLQICLMGEILEADLRCLVEALRGAIAEPISRAPSAVPQATWRTSDLPALREAQ